MNGGAHQALPAPALHPSVSIQSSPGQYPLFPPQQPQQLHRRNTMPVFEGGGEVKFFDASNNFHLHGFNNYTPQPPPSMTFPATTPFPKLEPTGDSPPPGRFGSWGMMDHAGLQFGGVGQGVMDRMAQQSLNAMPHDDQTSASDNIEATDESLMVATPAPSSQRAPTPGSFAWADSIASIDDARKHFTDKAVVYRKLTIEDDDVADFTPQYILTVAKELFKAIVNESTEAGGHLNAEEKRRFKASQQATHEKCKELLAADGGLEDASAHCILTIQKVVDLHTIGIPSSIVRKEDRDAHKPTTPNSNGGKKLAFKTTGGYRIDLTSKCSERVQTIINKTLNTKLVAVHILTGDQLQELVCAPDGFAARKVSNFRGNHKKQVQMSDGKEAKKQEAEVEAGEDGAENGQSKGEKSKQKRKSSAVVAASADDDDEDDNNVDSEPVKKRVKRDNGANETEATHKI